VHLKNLFLVFLLVTSCIKVGKNEEISQQRSFRSDKKSDLTNIKSVLIEKSFAFITLRWTPKRTKKKSINKQKVGPILFDNVKNFYLNKCARLTSNFCRGILSNLFCVTSFLSDEKCFKILRLFFRLLTFTFLEVMCYECCWDNVNLPNNSYTNERKVLIIIDRIYKWLNSNVNKLIMFFKNLETKLKDKYNKTEIPKDFKSLSPNLIIRNKLKKLEITPRCLSLDLGIKELLGLLRSTVTSDKDHKLLKEMLLQFSPTKKVFYISNITILSITIYLTLLKGNIESNPGEKIATTDFGIISYNCNGLGDQKKLRRLLRKLTTEVEKGKIIFLQETHLVKTDYLNILWKHKYISNCVRTNSAGVMVLFNNQYKVLQQELDLDGRSIVAVLESQDSKLIISNTYFYNDHGLGI